MQRNFAEGFVLGEQHGGEFVLGIDPKECVGGSVPEKFTHLAGFATAFWWIQAHGKIDSESHLAFVRNQP